MITLPIWVMIIIIVAHFVGDFFCQTQKMVEWKSNPKTKVPALIFHSFIYSVVLCLFALFFAKIGIDLLIWVGINMVLHFIVDFITSDIYKHFAIKHGFKRGFFNTLGADQMVHLACLFGSFYIWLMI